VVLSTVPTAGAHCLLSTWRIWSSVHCALHFIILYCIGMLVDLFQILTGELLTLFYSSYDIFICCICYSLE
jgi:hypothetical protein